MDASRFSPLLSTETAVFMDRDGAEQAEQHAGGGCAVYQPLLTMAGHILKTSCASISFPKEIQTREDMMASEMKKWCSGMRRVEPDGSR